MTTRKSAALRLTAIICIHSARMPIHTTLIDFPIHDPTTLRFVGHCTQHWNNFTLCSDAHVAFMKHLACFIFNLPAATQLIGILFEVFCPAFFGFLQ